MKINQCNDVRFIVVLFLLTVIAHAESIVQRQALIDLYVSTNGATSWKSNCRTQGWRTLTLSSTVCTSVAQFFGIRCSSGSITHLLLNDCGLSGTLPSTLATITTLQYLYLYSNTLSGTLPAEWSQMSQLLQLALYSNTLSGTLPSEWSQMSQLLELILYSNTLSGTLPSQWSQMSKLQLVYLYDNTLSGSLPSEWSQMSQLQYLRLDSNTLTGMLPSQWSQMSQLQQLVLHNNTLSGTLPSEWSQMSQLQVLTLDRNTLSGTLPSEWSQMSQLQHLYLYSNTLSGTLPSQWSQMSQLRYLYLNSNTLSGTLPSQWSQLSQLQRIYLYSNTLSGTLPSQWSQLSQLQRIYLYSNTLSGTLPSQWSQMLQLQELGLNNNVLSGTLPSQWSQMLQLQELGLNNNVLSGTLPSQWSQMLQLQELGLNNNVLSGTLPSEWSLGMFSFLLSGQPCSVKCHRNGVVPNCTSIDPNTATKCMSLTVWDNCLNILLLPPVDPSNRWNWGNKSQIGLSPQRRCTITESMEDLSKTQTFTLTKTESTSLTSRFSISQTSSLSISQTSRLSISQTSRLSISQTSRLSISQTSRLSISQTSRLSISQTSRLSISQTSSLSISQTSRLSISQTSRLSISQTSRLSISQTSRLSISQTSRLSISQTSSLIVTQSVSVVAPQGAQQSSQVIYEAILTTVVSVVVGVVAGSAVAMSSRPRAALQSIISLCQGDGSEADAITVKTVLLQSPLDVASSPTQLGFGSEVGYFIRGSLVGDGVLLCSIALSGALFVFILHRLKKVSYNTASGMVRMPSMLHIPFMFLAQPIVTASVWGIGSDSSGDVAIGVVGLLMVLLYCGWATWVCTCGCDAIYRRVRSTNKDIFYLWLQTHAPEFIKHPLLGLSQEAHPNTHYEWCNTQSKSDRFVERYSIILCTYRGGRQITVAIEMLAAVVMGVLGGVALLEAPSCPSSLQIVYLVLSIGLLLFTMLAQPYASSLDHVTSLLTHILGVSWAAAELSGSDATAEVLAEMLFWLNVVLLGLCLFWMVVDSSWRHNVCARLSCNTSNGTDDHDSVVRSADDDEPDDTETTFCNDNIKTEILHSLYDLITATTTYAGSTCG